MRRRLWHAAARFRLRPLHFGEWLALGGDTLEVRKFQPLFCACSRSAEMNGYTAAVLREQYLHTAMSPHFQLLPHLFGYASQSGLLAPQPRAVYPQSHPLVMQLVAAEDLAPLATPMLIEDG